MRLVLGMAVVAGAMALSASANAQNFNGTCINVHYQGPRLVATCLNAFGGYNTSSIDVRSCPPDSIGNGNGSLVCTAGSGGGGYGYRPRRYGPPPYGY